MKRTGYWNDRKKREITGERLINKQMFVERRNELCTERSEKKGRGDEKLKTETRTTRQKTCSQVLCLTLCFAGPGVCGAVGGGHGGGGGQEPGATGNECCGSRH